MKQKKRRSSFQRSYKLLMACKLATELSERLKDRYNSKRRSKDIVSLVTFFGSPDS